MSSPCLSLAVLTLAPLAPSAAPQGQKLNDPLARPIGGDVLQYRLDPGGNAVVFRADMETDEVFELFVSRLAPGGIALTKLSAPMVAGGDVLTFQLTSDGRHAVYLADQEHDAAVELYSVALDGGTPRKLNPPLPSGADVGPRQFAALALTPDGRQVVYGADAEQDDRNELYLVPLDGSAPARRLSGGEGDVLRMQLSADGTRLVYATATQLYSAVLDGSRGVRELGPVGQGGGIQSFALAPDGARVVYRGNAQRSVPIGLFSVPIDGLAPGVELSRPPGAGGHPVLDFELAGTQAAYREDTGSLELYGVPIDGSRAAVRLNAPLAAGEFVLDVALAPDASRAAYSTTHALFSVPLDASAPALQLSPPLPLFARMWAELHFSADSTRVVYEADQVRQGRIELFSVLADGAGAPVRLNPPLVRDGGVRPGFELAGDSVLFLAAARVPGRVELFRAPLAGGPSERLSGELVPDGDVAAPQPAVSAVFTLSADGRRVVYMADAVEDEAYELFGVPFAGGREPLELTSDLVRGPVLGDVLEHRVSADGAWCVYRADQDQDEKFELYRADAYGRGESLRLSAALGPGLDVSSFRLAPDGAEVLYRAGVGAAGPTELWSVPTASGAPARRLSASGGHVSEDYAFTPDGATVVYAASALPDGKFELFSVRADGSTPPVKLSGTLTTGGRVFARDVPSAEPAFRLAPDGFHVVYAADARVFELHELFSAPVDGSAAPLRLNPDLVQNGDVAFSKEDGLLARIAPRGGRVLYLADQEQDGRRELFSVPLDASAPALKLNPVLVAGDAGVPLLTGDGTRAVFTARSASPARMELYSVASDGSTPARRLTPLALALREIVDVALADGDQRVVFRARGPGGEALFSAPLDASAAPVRLAPAASGLPPTSSERRAFALRLTPDGLQVVYEMPAQRPAGLFVVPVDGSAPPRRVDTPAAPAVGPGLRLTPDGSSALYLGEAPLGLARELFLVPLAGGPPQRVSAAGTRTVLDFELAPRGERVIYRADADGRGVDELYLSFLTRVYAPTR